MNTYIRQHRAPPSLALQPKLLPLALCADPLCWRSVLAPVPWSRNRRWATISFGCATAFGFATMFV